ncbi:hypothetical protein [Streptomyces sp. ISL-94]|nr:hypothetical protein [Streptomyces sp. ISL-94]MBT2479743.1 hypothetical protein [Streptomyces sp. ISL-94]
MLDWILAVVIPVALFAMGALAFWLWVRWGTDDPVEHHSSMPSSPDWPEG